MCVCVCVCVCVCAHARPGGVCSRPKPDAALDGTRSAGKSLVADVVLLRALTRRLGAGSHAAGCKAMFVVPFVSLVQQRAAHLRALTADVGGGAGQAAIHVSECYGQKGTTLASPAPEVAVCTIEKANSLLNRLLLGPGGRGVGAIPSGSMEVRSLGLVVIDEMHMVGDKGGRGALLELMASKLAALAPHTHVVALSATLNAESLPILARWLRRRRWTGAASGDVCDFPPKLDDFPPTRWLRRRRCSAGGLDNETVNEGGNEGAEGLDQRRDRAALKEEAYDCDDAALFSTTFRPVQLREYYVVDGLVRPVAALAGMGSAGGRGGGGAGARRVAYRCGKKADQDGLAGHAL